MAELESAMEFLNRIHKDATDEDAIINEDAAAEMVEARDEAVRRDLLLRIEARAQEIEPTRLRGMSAVWSAFIEFRSKYSDDEPTKELS